MSFRYSVILAKARTVVVIDANSPRCRSESPRAYTKHRLVPVMLRHHRIATGLERLHAADLK